MSAYGRPAGSCPYAEFPYSHHYEGAWSELKDDEKTMGGCIYCVQCGHVRFLNVPLHIQGAVEDSPEWAVEMRDERT